MSVRVLTLLMAVAAAQAPSRPSPDEAFEAARVLYDQGRYQEAAARYQALLGHGFDEGVLHYNLGNAYFRDGRVARAILQYERALRRMPGDADARANLEYARERVDEGSGAIPPPPYVAWAVRLYAGLTPDFLAAVLSASFMVGGTVLSLRGWARRPRARTTIMCVVSLAAVVSLVAASTLAAKLHEGSSTVEAIVLVERSEVKSGPAPRYLTLAEILRGWKVSVLGSREEWIEVSLANGLRGWIRRGDAETIE